MEEIIKKYRQALANWKATIEGPLDDEDDMGSVISSGERLAKVATALADAYEALDLDEADEDNGYRCSCWYQCDVGR